MWRNWLGGSRDIYRSVSADGGKTFTEAVKLGTGTWPLKGCPMDGGSIGVDGDQVVYVWRRELKLFATTSNAPETLITDSGAHPLALPTADGKFQYFWQSGGNLLTKKQGKQTMFAKNAAYASGTWVPATKTAVVVWEGSSGDVTSVFFAGID